MLSVAVWFSFQNAISWIIKSYNFFFIIKWHKSHKVIVLRHKTDTFLVPSFPTLSDLQPIALETEFSVMLIAKDVISSCFVNTKICCMFKIE
jgi:hypothetical protein